MSKFNSENIPSFSVDNAMSVTPPPLDRVFRGMLAGTVGAMVSPGGAGKSFLAFGMAIGIACGRDLTESLDIGKIGKVTYYNAEDGQDILHTRINAISQYLTPEEKKLVVENMTICPLVSQFPWLLDDKAQVQQPVLDYLIKQSEGQRLIIIDTMRRFHAADENSSSAMATLVAVLEEIAQKTGAAVLFLHHTNKSALSDDGGDNQGASRGSSVLVDNARYVLNISGMPRPKNNGENRQNGQLISENARKYYLRLNDSKINNAVKNDETWLFRRPGGVLVKANFDEATEFPFLLDSIRPATPAPVPEKKGVKAKKEESDNVQEKLKNLF